MWYTFFLDLRVKVSEDVFRTCQVWPESSGWMTYNDPAGNGGVFVWGSVSQFMENSLANENGDKDRAAESDDYCLYYRQALEPLQVD